jgi:hypothetical protein
MDKDPMQTIQETVEAEIARQSTTILDEDKRQLVESMRKIHGFLNSLFYKPDSPENTLLRGLKGWSNGTEIEDALSIQNYASSTDSPLMRAVIEAAKTRVRQQQMDIREPIQEILADISQSVQKLDQYLTSLAIDIIPAEGTSKSTPEREALLNEPTTVLNVSVRARKSFSRLDIRTLRDLVQKTPDQLLATKNFGISTLNEVRQALAHKGLKLWND